MDERFVYEQAVIGSGGFGKVRKGKDTLLERDIAIKTLDPLAVEFSEAEQERFRREARVLAKLSHPNIPAIYDVNFSSGKFSIIFQYIDGQDLRKIIDSGGPVQISTARVWFNQIASALDHAHKLGIVHRDIKPENIIITSDLQSAYLVDFGIALSAEELKKLTKYGYAIGTPGYMSPEQLAGEVVDSRSDIYSLGVTFYEVLAGKRIPLAGYEALAVNEAIPPQIDELILDCLEPKERRLESARLFMARLAGALSQPSKPLSDVLAHGKLHELSFAIESLSPAEFAALPAGQRVLILSKIVDVVGSNDYSLVYASERLLQLLLTRGVLVDSESYREIVYPSFRWAFEKDFDGRIGREPLRKTLEEAAFLARDGAYEVLKDEFLSFFKTIDLENKEDWYLHTMREVIEALMANPTCDLGAAELGEAFRKVNQIQRSRPRRQSAYH
jgi:serine/threonine protein kinase